MSKFHPRPALTSALARRALPAVVLLALAALPAGSSAAPTAFAATHQCSNTPHYPGTGYFTRLTVSGTSCSTGDKLILAYYHCRVKHGAAGTCHSTVLGYTCRERRNSIPTEIDAKVTCTRGSATIVHYYQQDIN